MIIGRFPSESVFFCLVAFCSNMGFSSSVFRFFVLLIIWRQLTRSQQRRQNLKRDITRIVSFFVCFFLNTEVLTQQNITLFVIIRRKKNKIYT